MCVCVCVCVCECVSVCRGGVWLVERLCLATRTDQICSRSQKEFSSRRMRRFWFWPFLTFFLSFFLSFSQEKLGWFPSTVDFLCFLLVVVQLWNFSNWPQLFDLSFSVLFRLFRHGHSSSSPVNQPNWLLTKKKKKKKKNNDDRNVNSLIGQSQRHNNENETGIWEIQHLDGDTNHFPILAH